MTGEIIASRPNKTVFREGDQAVKLFGADYSAADVLNEALGQARVQETGLPVPRLEEVCKRDGQWAIVSEFIEGPTLAQAMQEQPDRLEHWLDLFVTLQQEVHERRSPRLTQMHDKFHRKISFSGLDATARYELHNRLDAMPRHNKICHGDFIPSNVLLRGEKTPTLIDWAHVTQGNASADAAKTYLLLLLRAETELAEQYLKLYCKKSDTARQYIGKWLPVVAAAQLQTCREEDRAFFRGQVEQAIEARG
ncbi:MAG: phosphotransferase [Oscillospiraceae bacterium]|jgi:aminoglycoside phosphotransferase (APT) family kinase protein|nr:phosphotransferase [Oscillospiraceae bacterium]